MEFFSSQLQELQFIISKMPIRMFCVTVLPEFNIRWRDMARTVRNSRLAMTPANVARVLCKHVAKSMGDEDITDIVGRLRLKFIATQNRTWHLVTLSEQQTTEPIEKTINLLPKRIIKLLKQGKTSLMRVQVHTVMIESLMFISVQTIRNDTEGPILYAATPLGEPVLLINSKTINKLTKALIQGLGYSSYGDAKLHGTDIMSLLCINNGHHDDRADHMAGTPEYAPFATPTPNGIDFTNSSYTKHYVESILGPDPPLLTEMNVTITKPFYDPTILNKKVTMKIQLKSPDIAETLKSCVVSGALAPTSELLGVFNKIKSNDIVFSDDGFE